MRASEITETLDRPFSRELPARDVLRLAYVAKDGTPRSSRRSGRTRRSTPRSIRPRSC
ncbi:hypothetical protein N7U49_24255 [Streptomyces sp. AD2-2]|nr:hypothetical protein N7U49_24255 [Streptomyces sp. AD2-2]